MKTTPRFSRRSFLRLGAGALSLPLLEAMLPAGRRGAAYADELIEPVRLLWFYVPNGIHMPSWTPATTGAGFVMPPILAPLERHRAHTLVLSQVANRNAIDSVPGDHARGTGAFLTARLPRQTEGTDISVGISADQVAASVLGAGTRLPSLQTGLEGGVSVGGCDSGYSCAYLRNISWADEATPLPKITNPLVVFQRLFGLRPGELSPEQIERQRSRRESILDFAVQDALSLQARLGANDRQKLDQYLTGIRDLERRILDMSDLSCGPEEVPEAFEGSLDAYSDIMNELMVQAMVCDNTRVITHMFANGGSNRSYDFIGVTGAHHEISHHQNIPENFERLERINEYEVGRLADLMDRMTAHTLPDGRTLLDQSALFFSSEIEDGNSHAHTNLPVLLCGGAGGALRGGRHIRFASETPVANVFVSMLHAANVGVDTFGADGNRVLPELTTG